MFVVSNVERYSGFSAGHIQRLFRPNLDVESAVVWEVDRTRPVVVGIVVTTGVVREYLESALKPGAILKGCTGKSIDKRHDQGLNHSAAFYQVENQRSRFVSRSNPNLYRVTRRIGDFVCVNMNGGIVQLQRGDFSAALAVPVVGSKEQMQTIFRCICQHLVPLDSVNLGNSQAVCPDYRDRRCTEHCSKRQLPIDAFSVRRRQPDFHLTFNRTAVGKLCRDEKLRGQTFRQGMWRANIDMDGIPSEPNAEVPLLCPIGCGIRCIGDEPQIS